MFRLIRKRMKGEKGFTLIELLVVIIIIAILAAIAIPTFLGQRNKANDASAKSLVRNAMTAMETIYVDGRDFSQATATSVASSTLAAIEPSITFIAGANAGTNPGAYANNTVYFTVDASTPDNYQIGARSKSGKIFGVTVVKAGVGAGTTYNPAPW
jgi:type IV pilus assembly protein PilA